MSQTAGQDTLSPAERRARFVLVLAVNPWIPRLRRSPWAGDFPERVHRARCKLNSAWLVLAAGAVGFLAPGGVTFLMQPGGGTSQWQRGVWT